MRTLLDLAPLVLTPFLLQDARADRAISAGIAYLREGTDSSADGESKIDLHLALPPHLARLARIEAEIATLGEHDWAGLYTFGNGTGRNISLHIAPESGATYTWMGCLGTYDLNHGDLVALTPEGLELALVHDPGLNMKWYPAALARPYMSKRWIPVAWGRERFMVPECQIIPFCNDVNGGGAAAGFARRRTDPDADWRERPRRPEGLPGLPATYAPFLLDEPLTTTLREASEPRLIGDYLGGPSKYAVTARIDPGLDDGLLPGMLLHAVEPEHQGVGEVVEAAPHGATLEFRFALYDHARDVPQPGWQLSTRWRTTRK